MQIRPITPPSCIQQSKCYPPPLKTPFPLIPMNVERKLISGLLLTFCPMEYSYHSCSFSKLHLVSEIVSRLLVINPPPYSNSPLRVTGHTQFLQAGCSSRRPTNSVKAQKANPSLFRSRLKTLPFNKLPLHTLSLRLTPRTHAASSHFYACQFPF